MWKNRKRGREVVREKGRRLKEPEGRTGGSEMKFEGRTFD